jgi:hypothetical protein
MSDFKSTLFRTSPGSSNFNAVDISLLQKDVEKLREDVDVLTKKVEKVCDELITIDWFMVEKVCDELITIDWFMGETRKKLEELTLEVGKIKKGETDVR